MTDCKHSILTVPFVAFWRSRTRPPAKTPIGEQMIERSICLTSSRQPCNVFYLREYKFGCYPTVGGSMDSKSNDPRYNFYANPTIEEIIAQQGKSPIMDVSVLHGDF